LGSIKLLYSRTKNISFHLNIHVNVNKSSDLNHIQNTKKNRTNSLSEFIALLIC